MEDKIEALREVLWGCVRKAQADGHPVSPDIGSYYGHDVKGARLCLVGAVLHSHGLHQRDELITTPSCARAGVFLDIPTARVHSLERGFEGWNDETAADLGYYKLGEEIRQQLKQEAADAPEVA